eukprot:2912459-Prymnesium_polylepis.1
MPRAERAEGLSSDRDAAGARSGSKYEAGAGRRGRRSRAWRLEGGVAGRGRPIDEYWLRVTAAGALAFCLVGLCCVLIKDQ